MSPTIEALGPEDGDALRALLTRDVAHNLYLLGLFEEFGVVPREGRRPFTFWGRWVDGRLTAAVFVGGDGGLVVPSAVPSAAEAVEVAAIAQHLAKRGRVHLRACVGEREAVEAVLRHLAAEVRPRTCLVQRLFKVSADDLGPFTNPTLRPAVEEDVPQLLPMAAACVKELLGRDPREEDPEGFEARVLQRVRGRRTYVLEVDGRLVFKIDVGSLSQHGAELEGLYTVPDQRRRGHATLSLGQICRHLLSSIPRLTLRVDEANPSFAGVVRKVGFVAGRQQKLVVME